MLTITVRIKTLGYEDVNSTDISSKLGAFGFVSWRGLTLFLEYQPKEHQGVFDLLNSADDWVQGVALEKAEANYGHGSSTLVPASDDRD